MSKVAATTITACPTLLPSPAYLGLVCTCGAASLADWFPARVQSDFVCMAALVGEQQAQLWQL